MTDDVINRVEACKARAEDLKDRVDEPRSVGEMAWIESEDFDDIIDILESIEIAISDGDYQDDERIHDALKNVEDSMDSMEALLDIYGHGGEE
jgi:hypothetical protein